MPDDGCKYALRPHRPLAILLTSCPYTQFGALMVEFSGSEAGLASGSVKREEGAHEPSRRGRQFLDTQSLSWVRAR